jgi:hypothetical protein
MPAQPEVTAEQVALTSAVLTVASYVSAFRDEILDALETSTAEGGYGEIAQELRGHLDNWSKASENFLRSFSKEAK